MARDWPHKLYYRSFTPAEVHTITSVDPKRQRLIAQRHRDFRSQEDLGALRPKWDWAGVQSLALFDGIASHLGPSAAERVFESAAFDAEMTSMDLRHPDDGDLFVVLRLGDLPQGFEEVVITNAAGIQRELNRGYPGLGMQPTYALNYSGLQRRICEQLGWEGSN